VTRDEARKLLSGYATGSLTELERQLLFDAALDDQELFDELAEEQVLKEIIDLPGAKDRLITALTPAPQRQFVWWPWAAGVAALATIVIAVWTMQRPAPQPTELAANVPVPTAAPAPKQEPERATQVFEQVAPKVAPPKPVAPEPEAPPPPAEKTTTLADRLTPTETAAPPAQLEARARQELPSLAITGASSAAQAKGQLANSFAATATRATSVASGEALTYEVRPTGILRVTPTRSGFLAVTYDGRPLFPTNPVVPGTPIDISIPLEAKELRIDFATTANTPAPAAVQSQESTGTLTLPTGPNPRAVILIPAQH
jgi:hypothetical protein